MRTRSRHYTKLELAGIYRQRGLDAALAEQVAEQLMKLDALGAHARDLWPDELTFSRESAEK